MRKAESSGRLLPSGLTMDQVSICGDEVIVGQGDVGRSIEETLTVGWELMSELPMGELKRVRDFIDKYHPNASEGAASA